MVATKFKSPELMKTNPLVSIIIPTYNRAHLIEETLDSVMTQTYTNWECIIVDDGSTDDTETVVMGYMDRDSRFRFYHRPPEHMPGGNGARNYGFKMSKGEYVNWFDSDDLMLKNFIEKKLNALSTTYFDIVFCGYSKFGETLYSGHKYNTIYSGHILDDLVENRVVFSTLTFMIKRECLEGVIFNESVLKSQDLDFFFRLFTTHKELALTHISEVLFYVRKHSNSISSLKSTESIKIKSKLKVHRNILDYFFKRNHKKGIERYFYLCMVDYRLLLENKNIRFVLVDVFGMNEISFLKKLKFLLFIIYYLITGKIITIEKKIKFN